MNQYRVLNQNIDHIEMEFKISGKPHDDSKLYAISPEAPHHVPPPDFVSW